MLPINLKLFDGTITEDGETKSVGIKVQDFRGGWFFIKVSAPSGTDPTLEVDIITYDKTTEAWYVIGYFDQFVAAGEQALYIPDVGEEIAIQYRITGTDTPSFPAKVGAILRD